jgi:hypothetical protein
MPNEQKTPLTRTLADLATNAALKEIKKRGAPLPGKVTAVNGGIVTVSLNVKNLTLPPVQMPIFGPEYIRYPIQVNDLGVAFPMPVYTGSASGLGPNVPADIDQLQSNLTMMWFPCGNVNWSTTPNANAVVIYGPQGVIIENAGATVTITLTSSGITLATGSEELVITSSGIHLGPNTTIDSRLFLAHTHSGVTTGTGATGPVV